MSFTNWLGFAYLSDKLFGADYQTNFKFGWVSAELVFYIILKEKKFSKISKHGLKPHVKPHQVRDFF